ncbi:MAG: ATP-binding protein [Sphingobacteriia bacterium]|nr:ATP-binding protein [Sphingobacteriia bacterium]
MKPILFVFSGLPGTGKTTISKEISKHYKATYIRIDTVEQGLRDLCNYNVQGEGYRLSYRLVLGNLLIGNSVVVDCCNPIEMTRQEWNDIGIKGQAKYINIEIVCTDKIEHKKRIEERINDIEGLKLPLWKEIENRYYEEWKDSVIRIDTTMKSKKESVNELIKEIGKSIKNFA